MNKNIEKKYDLMVFSISNRYYILFYNEIEKYTYNYLDPEFTFGEYEKPSSHTKNKVIDYFCVDFDIKSDFFIKDFSIENVSKCGAWDISGIEKNIKNNNWKIIKYVKDISKIVENI